MPIAVKPSRCSFSGLFNRAVSRTALPKAWHGPAPLSSPACGSIRCCSLTIIDITGHPLTSRSLSMKDGGVSRPELRAGFNYFQLAMQDDERQRREKITGRVLTSDRSLED